MLEKYPTSIKIGTLINLIISIFSILWGIFEVEEWPLLIFGPFIAITLILFFISKFVLNNTTIKPIYDGFFWGITIPAILFSITLLDIWIADKLNTGGGSADMAGLGGILLFIFLSISSGLIFLIALTTGLITSYKISKNKIVLGFTIIMSLITITSIILIALILEGSILNLNSLWGLF